MNRPLPEDEEIEKVHPLRTGKHELWVEAMRLVGAKHSKLALVALVNWLLFKLAAATAERDALMARCSCDAFSDAPCPVHARENALQDEAIALRSFLARTAHGGTIVSSVAMTPTQIAIARAADRMLVMPDGYGFVYVPGPHATNDAESRAKAAEGEAARLRVARCEIEQERIAATARAAANRGDSYLSAFAAGEASGLSRSLAALAESAPDAGETAGDAYRRLAAAEADEGRGLAMGCPCMNPKARNAEPQYPRKQGDRCKLFWCVGCKSYQPWCCGGHPDARCDTCTSRSHAAESARKGRAT